MMSTYEPWNEARGAEIIAEHDTLEGATLVILHALQEAFGYVPEPAIPMIAAALHLSRAEVHGVFTFYHDFRHKPAGRHVLKLCRAEACQAAGGDVLAARAEAKLGVPLGNTTADDRVRLAPVYCPGLCATAPSAMPAGRFIGRLGEKGLERALSPGSDAILAEVTASGLRGRGGAGFPTGIKWKTVAQAKADRKFIVCNADEGDSGTFADRMIMEGDPFLVIEGMTTAGITVG